MEIRERMHASCKADLEALDSDIARLRQLIHNIGSFDHVSPDLYNRYISTTNARDIVAYNDAIEKDRND
jgi:hypothetical protein